MNEDWLKENGYMALKAFSESVKGDMDEGFIGVIDKGELDFVIYNCGTGRKIYTELDLPLMSISIEEKSTKEEFVKALKESKLIIGYDISKFDIPLIQKALDEKIETPLKDLLTISIDATQSYYGNERRRIPLHILYKKNSNKHRSNFMSYIGSHYIRLRDWRRGGTRSVLKCVNHEVAFIILTAHAIYKTNLIKFPDYESNKTVSMIHDFKGLGLSESATPTATDQHSSL